MKNMMTQAALFSVSAMALVLTACGSDKTVEEFQQERLGRSLAVYESVSGTYTGTVTGSNGKKAMGALELELRARTATREQASGDLAIGTPILVTNVRFKDKTMVQFTVETAYYNEQTHLYSATIQIPRTVPGAGTPIGAVEQDTIVIQGYLNGDNFSGTIGAQGSSSVAGVFTLKRNGRPLDEISKGTPPGELETRGVTRVYKGVNKFGGKNKTQYLRVTRPSRGPKGDFVDTFFPEGEKVINVSWLYSESLAVSFTGIKWDQQNGIIDGQTSFAEGAVYLRCENFYFTNQTEEFSCIYTAEARGMSYNLKFKPTKDTISE